MDHAAAAAQTRLGAVKSACCRVLLRMYCLLLIPCVCDPRAGPETDERALRTPSAMELLCRTASTWLCVKFRAACLGSLGSLGRAGDGEPSYDKIPQCKPSGSSRAASCCPRRFLETEDPIQRHQRRSDTLADASRETSCSLFRVLEQ